MFRLKTPLLIVLLLAGQARAQELPPKPKEAKAALRSDMEGSLAERGTSARLFDMPVADVVGPYQASISYDGSLLENPGILSSAGVAALGIGDLGQVEYRHTSAIGLRGGSVPLPSVGVQIKLPFEMGPHVPALALAYRFGIEHQEELGGVTYLEKATDVYGVAHLILPAAIHLHIGARLTSAEFNPASTEKRDPTTLFLPALGFGREMGLSTTAIAELGRAPLFDVDESGAAEVQTGITGRLGLRWRLHPRFSFDASAGYLAKETGIKPGEILAWDIRLGGELFIPWGAIACHTASLFCN